jgi:hypothetical protein
VPRVAADCIARIAQRFVLEAFRIETEGAADGNQMVAIARDEVRHRISQPNMPMQPKAARHGVDHSLATIFEFLPANRRRYEIINY